MCAGKLRIRRIRFITSQLLVSDRERPSAKAATRVGEFASLRLAQRSPARTEVPWPMAAFTCNLFASVGTALDCWTWAARWQRR